MFHGKISLSLVLLLLLVNFVSGFRLELIYTYIPHCKYQIKPLSSPWFTGAYAAAIVHRNHFFHFYQQNKSSESKGKFREASNVAKVFLKLPNLHMLIKQNSLSLPRDLALGTFGELLIVFSTKLICYILYSSASDITKLFTKNFSKNPNFDDSEISLPIFPSRTNLKLHHVFVTGKVVKRVIMNLASSKVSGPVVVLRNCDPKLSHVLAELFNMCLKESCFLDCWKVSFVFPVFKNVGERSTGKNYHHPVTLLSVVNKVFEKLLNNNIVDHLEK